MDSIARALLLREALSTTRMSLPDLSDLVYRKGECPIHDNEGETVIAQRNYTVAPGEYVTEWLEENAITMEELAFALGVNETYTTDLIEGKIPINEEIALALEKLTGIPVKRWAVLDATYWADKARLAKIDVTAAVAARRDELLGEIVEDDEPLVHHLADER